jgi:hypothetical protein
LGYFLVDTAKAAVAHDHYVTVFAYVFVDPIDESIDVIFDGRGG